MFQGYWLVVGVYRKGQMLLVSEIKLRERFSSTQKSIIYLGSYKQCIAHGKSFILYKKKTEMDCIV